MVGLAVAFGALAGGVVWRHRPGVSTRATATAGAVVLVIVGAWSSSPLLGLVGPILVVVSVAEHDRRARVEADRRVTRQVPVVVDQLIQRLQSGHSLFTVVGELDSCPPDVAPLLAPAARSLRSGRSLATSIDRLPTDDPRIGLLAATLRTLAGNGGPGVPALQRLRFTVVGLVQADDEAAVHAGQALASASLLAFAPGLFSLLVAGVDTDARRLYGREWIGAGCVAIAVVLSYGGWRWMAHSVARASGRAGRRRRDQELVEEALAPTIDMIAVVVGAGGTIGEAVELVSERGPEPARAAFDRVRAARRRGVLLTDALAVLSDELGSAFHPLTAALVVSAQGGAPVGTLLQRLADEANRARRRVIEARVRRLPVTLVVPLVVCQLPAVIVGSVLPLALLAVRSLQA